MRTGLAALVNGKSKRSAAELSGVPPNTLVRHFVHLTGQRPKVKQPLNKPQREEALRNLPTFVPKHNGNRLFLPHEELLLVEMLEIAALSAFPYNSDALEASATNLGKAAYGANFTLGKANKWRKGFERRHKERIAKVKSSSICQRRAASATAEVRDAVFKHFMAFVDSLVEQGDLTPAQRENLGKHIANMEEVGGDERGKRKPVYQGKNAAWRSTTRDGDHNAFHVTLALVSIAIGKILGGVSLIHSAPGSKTARMRTDLYTHLPEHWHVRRTVSGSMTRELFQDWAVRVRSYMYVVCVAVNQYLCGRFESFRFCRFFFCVLYGALYNLTKKPTLFVIVVTGVLRCISWRRGLW